MLLLGVEKLVLKNHTLIKNHYLFQEKKKLYEDTHRKMEQTGDSFLESIQHEFEGGPGP